VEWDIDWMVVDGVVDVEGGGRVRWERKKCLLTVTGDNQVFASYGATIRGQRKQEVATCEIRSLFVVSDMGRTRAVSD